MKTTKGTVEDMLRKFPKFRERKHKDAGITYFLVEESPELKKVPRELLVKFAQDYASADRAWRQSLEKHPELRGSDYNQKFDLTRQHRLKLGYRS